MQCFEKLTISSFFSGMGGLDLGFKELFDIQWANERDPHAARGYAVNIGDHIQVGDITELSKSDIVPSTGFIGGPSCTDYSTDGANRGDVGEHGKLVWTYQDITWSLMPQFFLFENVSGLVNRHPQTFERLLANYKRIGFNVSWAILDAAQFGVAQNRKRVFIAGIRKDLGFYFRFPLPYLERKTVRDVISSLPSPETIGARKRVLGSFPNHTVTGKVQHLPGSKTLFYIQEISDAECEDLNGTNRALRLLRILPRMVENFYILRKIAASQFERRFVFPVFLITLFYLL